MPSASYSKASNTVWLTQRLLADLYQIGVNTINHHVKSICDDGELSEAATIRQYRIVQTEGSRQVERLVDHYNLDMILAIGYRVRSTRGTQFRQWATARLSEYLVKGFTLDDQRLKGTSGVVDYFDELPRTGGKTINSRHGTKTHRGIEIVEQIKARLTGATK